MSFDQTFILTGKKDSYDTHTHTDHLKKGDIKTRIISSFLPQLCFSAILCLFGLSFGFETVKNKTKTEMVFVISLFWWVFFILETERLDIS